MNQFSAQEPSLGYHYQIRYALYLLLKTKDKENSFIRLENLDDVEIINNQAIELHQTKFHNKKAANLTDSSVDIWKTIRVWSEMIIKGSIDLDKTLFVLVTTSQTSEKSILHELTEKKTGTKTIKDIVVKLDEISNDSGNKVLKESFAAFRKMTNIQKESLLKNIYIRDIALSFSDLKKEIQKELRLFCLPQYIDNLYQSLEGWWYQQSISHLQNEKDNISYVEIRDIVIYLNDKLKSDNLPIDEIIKDAEVNENEYNDRTFIKQLKAISIGKSVIRQAKRDYYRALEQRSKWLREKLLNPQEEINYEANLKDDWRAKFATLEDDLEGKSPIQTQKKCKSFYIRFYGETCPNIYIRERVTESFIVRGSCQILADDKRIAWHPDFLTL